MDPFLSVLHGDTKQVVAAIGKNGIFYASALKALKKELEAESCLRPRSNIICLKHFYEQIKTTVTSLTSMGYTSSIKSTEHVTKL